MSDSRPSKKLNMSSCSEGIRPFFSLKSSIQALWALSLSLMKISRRIPARLNISLHGRFFISHSSSSSSSRPSGGFRSAAASFGPLGRGRGGVRERGRRISSGVAYLLGPLHSKPCWPSSGPLGDWVEILGVRAETGESLESEGKESAPVSRA